jgi:hypothetical protein
LTFALRLCHCPHVIRSEQGAASRSFVVGVTAVILGVAGYTTWSLLRPGPDSMSERIVREALREVAAEVREFERKLDALAHDSKRDRKDMRAEIDKRLASTLQGIDDVTARARTRLTDLEIGIRTQRNRMDRIEGRADEAKEMVKELADEAKQKVQGS